MNGARLFRAVVWLRFRHAANAFLRGGRRDAAARTVRRLEALLPLLLWVLLGPALAIVAGLGVHGGRLLADPWAQPALLDAARFALAASAASLLLGVVVRSAQGATRSSARFALLPVSRRALHRVEVAATLADPYLVVVFVAVAGIAGGAATSGSPGVAAAALAAGAGLVFLLAATASALSFGVAILLRHRGWRERLLLLGFGLLVALPLLSLILVPRSRPSAPRDPRESRTLQLPAIARRLPTELFVRAIGDAARGETGRAASASLALGVLAGGAYLLSARFHGALLDAGSGSGGGRRGVRPSGPGWVPLLPPAVAAVAVAQVRGALRTVQGKMGIVVLPLLAAASVTLVQRTALGMDAAVRPAGLAPGGVVPLAGGGLVLAVLGLQNVLFNQLGSDRAGLTRALLAPLPAATLLAGKAVGGALLYAAALAVYLAASTAAAWAFAGALIAPGDLVLLALAGVAAYVLLAPAAALASIALARAADLGAMDASGKAHPLAGMLGLATAVAATAPPVLIATLGPHLLRPGFTPLLLGAWIVFAAGIALVFFRAAERLLDAARESLALVACGR